MAIDGATRLFAILGTPLKQARSPGRFNALFADLGANAVLLPMEVGPDDAEAAINGLWHVGNFDGMFITMPIKHHALALCARLSPRAVRIDAVNAMRRTPDGWEGDMFDGIGCVRAMREASGVDPRGAAALVVGAGGAGAAVADALAEAGVGSLVIADADAARAEALAARLRDGFPACRIAAGPADPAGCSIAVNATPLGMRGEAELPFDPARMAAGGLVADAVISATPTPLLRAARAAGHRIQDGAAMNEGQAISAAAFFGFTLTPRWPAPQA